MLDPHHFNMDPDPHLKWYRIRIWYHWSTGTDPPRLHFEPPQRLHWDRPRPSMAKLGPLKLHSFDFNTDPDPGFYSNADPDSSPAKILRIRIRKPGYTSCPLKEISWIILHILYVTLAKIKISFVVTNSNYFYSCCQLFLVILFL